MEWRGGEKGFVWGTGCALRTAVDTVCLGRSKQLSVTGMGPQG